jgi:hypothetical protein
MGFEVLENTNINTLSKYKVLRDRVVGSSCRSYLSCGQWGHGMAWFWVTMNQGEEFIQGAHRLLKLEVISLFHGLQCPTASSIYCLWMPFPGTLRDSHRCSKFVLNNFLRVKALVISTALIPSPDPLFV